MAAFSDTAFSIAALSESAFDFGTGPVVADEPTGGWYRDFESTMNRGMAKRRLEDIEEEVQDIPNEQDREISKLLKVQEAKDQ